MLRSLRTRIAAVLALILGGTMFVAPPAQAFPGLDIGGDSPLSFITDFVTGGGAQCSMYANEWGFGLHCPGLLGGGEPQTIGELLDTEEEKFVHVSPPFPRCWQEDLPASVQSGELPPGEKRYLTVCTENYDGLNLQEQYPHEAEMSYSYSVLPPEKVTYLTEDQKIFADAVWQGSTFPPTFLEARPEDGARVNSDTRFFMKVQDASAIRPGEIQYMDPIAMPQVLDIGLQMRAYLHTLEVHPEGEGPGKPVVRCSLEDIMPVDGTTEEASPNSCWHTYTRSSATQPHDVYQARAYAYWQVQYSHDFGITWQDFPSEAQSDGESTLIRRGGTTRIPVRDVQTLVVP
ncbi:hypothetical protein GCM10022261_07590 [Brevibacterium daeguense]|uniref:Uncharacterized protein n=1 Tax=Brevibacterium daeguense TaxID=909936 RepID=A0ABP8EGZ0_9MICO|nr:hypothetical protein [Brevibacterium daeguense]